MLPKLRVRTDSEVYRLLCAGCEVCGRFPHTIQVDTIERRWHSGDRELIKQTPFGRCHMHPREPRKEIERAAGSPRTHLPPRRRT